MKTKKTLIVAAIIAAVVIVACVAGVCISRGRMAATDDGPRIAYIENVNYYVTDEVCEVVPRRAADGVIETFVPAEIMPDAFDSANFGQDQGQVPYMFLDDGKLIVQLDGTWYYCTQPEAE